MDIKIAFFDIDGTLLPFGEKEIHPAVQEALRRLREKGIRLMIATGRSPSRLPPFLPRELFDGYLCFNGSYCFDEDGVIHKNPMDADDIRMIVKNGERLGYPVMLAKVDKTIASFYQEELAEHLKKVGAEYLVADDLESLMKEEIIQLQAHIPSRLDADLLRGTRKTKCVRWWELATDIIPMDGGKASGVEAVLKHYGLSKEDAMAFGDGGNDGEMLACVGLGIAMGNAVPETMTAADYVTDSCQEDGVVTALRHFGMI